MFCKKQVKLAKNFDYCSLHLYIMLIALEVGRLKFESLNLIVYPLVVGTNSG